MMADKRGRFAAVAALASLAILAFSSCAESSGRQQQRAAGAETEPAPDAEPKAATASQASKGDGPEAGTKEPPRLTLTSPAFADSQAIPPAYTCQGRNASPPLAWRDPPPETTTYALVVDGPDAPGRSRVHWLVYNIPATTTSLPEGAGAQESPGGGVQGMTSWEKDRYGGPCPPPGERQLYYFQLFALKEPLSLPPEANKDEVVGAIEEKALDKAVLTGLFQR